MLFSIRNPGKHLTLSILFLHNRDPYQNMQMLGFKCFLAPLTRNYVGGSKYFCVQTEFFAAFQNQLPRTNCTISAVSSSGGCLYSTSVTSEIGQILHPKPNHLRQPSGLARTARARLGWGRSTSLPPAKLECP